MLRDLEPARTDERQHALGRTADRARSRGKEVRNGRTGQKAGNLAAKDTQGRRR